MPGALSQWVVRSPEPVTAQTGEGLALLSTDQGKYIVLNASAAAVWERLARPVRLLDLAEDIASHFGLERDVAASAVLDVVAEFRQLNIVATHTPL